MCRKWKEKEGGGLARKWKRQRHSEAEQSGDRGSAVGFVAVRLGVTRPRKESSRRRGRSVLAHIIFRSLFTNASESAFALTHSLLLFSTLQGHYDYHQAHHNPSSIIHHPESSIQAPPTTTVQLHPSPLQTTFLCPSLSQAIPAQYGYPSQTILQS